MNTIYHIKNSAGAILSAHFSKKNAQSCVNEMELIDKAEGVYRENAYTIHLFDAGIKLVAAKGKFPCKCAETGRKIFTGESYYFDVIGKKSYHPSADIVKIYFSKQNQ